MRVTETRMMEIANQGVARARDRAAQASQTADGGLRVAVPSDDVTAFSDGMRAESRALSSGSRGTAIARARDGLQATATALEGVSDALSSVMETTMHMANGSLSAADRKNGAATVRALRDQILTAANSRGSDGEFLFAGGQGAAAAFSQAGVYQGDAGVRRIEVAEGQSAAVTFNGNVLTAANGVDVFALLDKLATALDANSQSGVTATIADLQTAIGQVGSAREDVSTQVRQLDKADEARQAFELRLADSRSKSLEADPIAAATDLARSKAALDTARAVAEQLVAMTRPAGR